jgi:signal transduction histidine kinase
MDDRKNLYLIFKEALNNAVKHAHATRVVTHLKEVDGALELVIEDNGIGLPKEERATTLGGNGLKSMRKRAAELGAELELRPAAQGTRLVLRFPPRSG